MTKRVATVLELSGSYYDCLGPCLDHLGLKIRYPPKMAISNGAILINQWILRYLVLYFQAQPFIKKMQ